MQKLKRLRTTKTMFDLMVVAVPLLVASVTQAAVMYDVTALPRGTVTAEGINDSGEITGIFATSSGEEHAYIYSNGNVTDLGALTGGRNSYGLAINNNGQVTGWSDAAAGGPYGFLYSNGTMVNIGTLSTGGTADALPTDINNNGQVVGNSEVANTGYEHAFLYTGGAMVDLGALPGQSFSSAQGINESGQVVGWSSPGGGILYAFLYSAEKMTDIGGPGSFATSINDNGQVAGYFSVGGGAMDAFLYSNGSLTDIGALPGPPGDINTRALAISDSGQVVGWSVASDGSYHAFSWTGAGGMQDLNNLISPNSPINPQSGWVFEQADGVNSNGDIIGTGLNVDGSSAFLLTPVPEPATLSVLILCGLGLLARKRRSPRRDDI
jgi:probable HAF family extracellular repeat protein